MVGRVGPRGVVVVVLTLVLVAMVALAARGVWQRSHRSGLEQAVSVAPAATKRLGFTGWAAVRKRVGVAHPRTPAQVDRMVSKAYDLDLTATSSIDESAAALQSKFGFSPANADWEAYAQSGAGASMALKLGDDVDFDGIAGRLARLGYDKPSHDDGVWRGGSDLVASIDSTLSPEVQYVVLLADRHLVVTSDTASYAAAASRAAEGDADSLRTVAGVDDMAARVGHPATAIMWTRDFACSDLAMSQAATDDQATAERLTDAAGKVTPLSGLTMAMAADRDLTVAEQFEDSGDAHRNLRPRSKLVVGPDPVRSGDYSDMWKLQTARTEGSTVLLTLHPKEPSGFLLSNVYSGPVLFATC